MALSHLVVQYESNFCTVALQFMEEEKNYPLPSPAATGMVPRAWRHSYSATGTVPGEPSRLVGLEPRRDCPQAPKPTGESWPLRCLRVPPSPPRRRAGPPPDASPASPPSCEIPVLETRKGGGAASGPQGSSSPSLRESPHVCPCRLVCTSSSWAGPAPRAQPSLREKGL